VIKISRLYGEDPERNKPVRPEEKKEPDFSAPPADSVPSRPLRSELEEQIKKEEKREQIIRKLDLTPAEVTYNQGILLIRELLENVKNGSFVFPQGLIEVVRWIRENLRRDGEILFFVYEETPRNYLIAHTLNVTILAMKLFSVIKDDDLEMMAMGMAGLVHDLGMVNMMQLISKKGKLTEEEYMTVKSHAEAGAELLKNLTGLGEATKKFSIPVALYHHERHNGKGYPQGLKGERASLYARIFGVCDIFESLSHSRPYRAASPPAVALQKIIRLESDGWFDYKIVRAFVEAFSFYPLGSRVKLNSEETALVVRSNPQQPTRPCIEILEGENAGKIKDLSQEQFLYIREGL